MARSAGTNKDAGTAETEGSVRSDPTGTASAPEKARSRHRAKGRSTEAQRADSVIPWGYGADRVKALAVDPERLFVYWEITDEAIEHAREEMGASGQDAALVLRVYDITGRIFDGTNAHGHFDHGIGRDDRQWFFDVGKPSSEAIVEIGLVSREGQFNKIVRSGRVEFPRRNPVEHRPPRWLTVRLREGAPELFHHHVEPRAAAPRDEGGDSRFDGVPGTVAFDDERHSVTGEVGVETYPPWSERIPLSTLTAETRVFRREGDWTRSSWEAGPFTTEVELPGPWTEGFTSGVRVFRDGPQTRVVHGPWEVVIRGLGAHEKRAVLARWEIHRSWITEEGHGLLRRLPTEGELMTGSSARLGQGASERRWQAGSELRLAGASELLYRGASERRLGGATENRFLSASEWLVRGASERRLGGASERALRGASERRLGGGSDRRLGGASGNRPQAVRTSPYPKLDGDNEAG